MLEMQTIFPTPAAPRRANNFSVPTTFTAADRPVQRLEVVGAMNQRRHARKAQGRDLPRAEISRRVRRVWVAGPNSPRRIY